ncbi:MAG TPA: helix-turn-helix domain-containing protein [Bacillota bacterium]
MDENGEREGKVVEEGPSGLAAVGDLLRRTRESKGISLAQAQLDTKIRTKYLEALEAGKDGETPGEAYFKGFLRFYGNYLGLDGINLVTKYKEIKAAEVLGGREGTGGRNDSGARSSRAHREPRPAPSPASPPGTTPTMVRPTRVKRAQGPQRPSQRPRSAGEEGERRRHARRKRSPVVLIVISLLILGGLGYVGWRYLDHWQAANPPRSGENGPTGAGQTGGAAPGGSSGSAGGSTPVTGSPGTQPVPDFSKLVLEGRQTDQETTIYTLSVTEVVVTLKANERCWVRAVADGQTVNEEVLEAGREMEWSAKDRFELRMGNPGGVSLAVNSAPVDTGPREQPPRTLILTVKK